ncbi:MAG: response regulator [Chloroflexi bacterium]|nr:response regulator [Chloroflexota bacterium]
MKACRILLVEDNPDNFELIRFLLEREGYQVLEARDGSQGLRMARSERPDLVLMDLSLPQVDGWSAATQLKADPQTAGIPLVAITAHTLPGDRKRALESGFDGYISKPINVTSLNETVKKALEGK